MFTSFIALLGLKGVSVYCFLFRLWPRLNRKKGLATFPSPAGMSLTKLSLGLIIPAQGEFGK